MNQKQKGKYVGVCGALFVHLCLLLLLFLVGFTIPKPQEEGGVSVMLGEVPDAFGEAAPELVEVDVLPEEAPTQPIEQPEQPLLTQEVEETVAIEKKQEEPINQKTPEELEAERMAEEKRLAEEKAERERKIAEETARNRVANAFGRGAQMGDKGTTSGKGVQGSQTGNADTGLSQGAGGYGSFNLDGRSLGTGGLPRPVYNVQDEGRVVVTITVNPQGEVISTSINRQTNTVNPALRKAAEDAAKRARFNAVSGLNNQTGTITYYFNLK